jgi:hypothetical protein
MAIWVTIPLWVKYNWTITDYLIEELEKVNPDTKEEINIAKSIVEINNVTLNQLNGILDSMLPDTEAYDIISNKIKEAKTTFSNIWWLANEIEL